LIGNTITAAGSQVTGSDSITFWGAFVVTPVITNVVMANNTFDAKPAAASNQVIYVTNDDIKFDTAQSTENTIVEGTCRLTSTPDNSYFSFTDNTTCPMSP
jgi:hypothetical protein